MSTQKINPTVKHVINSITVVSCFGLLSNALQANYAETQLTTTQFTRENDRKERWGLNKEEWSRYLGVQNNPLRTFSGPNTSPIEVLGTYAETEDERARYARMFVDMKYEYTEKVLAFAAEIGKQERLIKKGMLPIDINKLKALIAEEKQRKEANKPDRIWVFMKPDNCAECDYWFQSVMVAADKGMSVDLFFKTTEETDIHTWVESHPAIKRHLNSGRITVNFEGDKAKSFGVSIAKLPAGFAIKNENAQQISIAEL